MQSNYYASKIFAEHPLALYPLDENVTYVSPLKQDTGWNLSTWTATNGTAAVSTDPLEVPADFMPTFETLATTSSGAAEVLFVSGIYDQVDALPFSVSAYAMAVGDGIDIYEIGVLTETVENNNTWTVYNGQTTTGAFGYEWVRLYAAYDFVPQRFKIYIKYKYLPAIPTPVNVYFNGIAAGEFAENYVSYDDGIATQAVPAALDPYIGANIRLEPAYRYDSVSDYGYYLVSVNAGSNWSDSKPLAKNDGIPMVFGASNSTAIYRSNGEPGIIFPGKGFLHERGRYNEYTVEFWMRQGKITRSLPAHDGSNNPQAQAIKIFGPIASTDGLYRDTTHLYLCVGDNIISYPILTWYRPMLIGVRIQSGELALTVNGEKVGSVRINQSDLVLPSAADANWIGFYNNGLDLFEVDCLAIYPYACPTILTKRRYAVGQGVDEINTIERAYLGKSFVFDYTKSGYSRNLVYPDRFSWDQGQSSNLILGRPKMELPEFEQPLVFATKSKSEWLADQTFAGAYVPYFKLKPTAEYNDFETRIELPPLDFMIDSVFGMRIDIKADNTTTYNLLQFYNKSTDETVYVKCNSTNVYFYKEATLVYSSAGLAGTTRRAININLSLLAKRAGFGNFWSNPSNIEVTLSQWPGRIYGVSYFNKYSYELNGYSTTSVAWLESVSDSADVLIGNFTYSLSMLPNGNVTDLVKSAGYWKDIVPLSYFAKEVNGVYRVDTLQFNSMVDDSPLSGIRDKVVTTLEFVLSEDAGLTTRPNEYTGTVPKKVLSLGTNWLNTEYGVTNNTVVVLPQNADVKNTFVVIRAKLTCMAQGVQDISLKRLELCSLAAHSDEDFFALGTRYGEKAYPLKYYANRYMVPAKTTMRITKEASPYLRLTEDSGIAILPSLTQLTESGGQYYVGTKPYYLSDDVASIAVIPNIKMYHIAENTSVIAMSVNGKNTPNIAGFKFWMCLDDVYTNNVVNEKMLAELVLTKVDGTHKMQLWIRPKASGQTATPLRYFLEARNEDGTPYTEASILQNIYQTVAPIIEPKRWTQVSVIFNNKQILTGPSFFNGYSGATFQNISFHEPSIISEDSQTASRSWLKLSTDPASDIWSEVDSLYPSWADVLYIERPKYFFFDSLGLTNSLFGTQAFVATSSKVDDISIASGDLDSLMDVKWSTGTYTPV